MVCLVQGNLLCSGELLVPELSLLDIFYPFLLLLAAGGFWTVYGLRPKMRSAFWFALSFLFGTFAFSVEFFRFVLPDVARALFAVGFYCGMGAFLVFGLIIRAEREPPYIVISAIAVTCTLTVFAFALADVHVLMRVCTAQFSMALLLLIGVGYARRRFTTKTDKALLIVTSFMALLLIIHPTVIGYYVGLPSTPLDYDRSALFLTMGLLTMVAALLCAALLVREAIVVIIGELKTLANRDELTGILNRRGFDEAVEDFSRTAQSKGHQFAILAVDIDYFKRINDTYGHGFGDRVIHSLGQMLCAHHGDDGLAGRVGGEEFVMALAVSSLEEACHMAELLRQRWARQTFFADQEDVRSTASFGVSLHRADQSLAMTIAQADKALYHAKQSGRNRVSTDQDVRLAALKQMTRFSDKAAAPDGAKVALKFSG